MPLARCWRESPHDEAHFPAPQHKPAADPRVSEATLHQGRSQGADESASERTLASGRHRVQEVVTGGSTPTSRSVHRFSARPQAFGIPGDSVARASCIDAALHPPGSSTGGVRNGGTARPDRFSTRRLRGPTQPHQEASPRSVPSHKGPVAIGRRPRGDRETFDPEPGPGRRRLGTAPSGAFPTPAHPGCTPRPRQAALGSGTEGLKEGDSPPSMVARFLILLIRIYQLTISPFLGGVCRFEPSCSRYTQACIALHGPLRGSWLGLKRIARCHPFHPGGYDPPPLPPGHLPPRNGAVQSTQPNARVVGESSQPGG